MKKSVLKKGLMHAFQLEEDAIIVSMEQISSILSLYLRSKKAKDEVQGILEVITKNNHHHRNTCQNLLSQLDMDTKNDY